MSSLFNAIIYTLGKHELNREAAIEIKTLKSQIGVFFVLGN